MKYLKNSSTLKYNSFKCIGCGMCTQVCPHEVFEIKSRKAFITDLDRCMECGACSINCPADAITVDKGVGCAAAVISSGLKGNKSVSCGCEDSGCCC